MYEAAEGNLPSLYVGVGRTRQARCCSCCCCCYWCWSCCCCWSYCCCCFCLAASTTVAVSTVVANAVRGLEATVVAAAALFYRREKHSKDRTVSFGRLKSYGALIAQITSCGSFKDVNKSSAAAAATDGKVAAAAVSAAAVALTAAAAFQWVALEQQPWHRASVSLHLLLVSAGSARVAAEGLGVAHTASYRPHGDSRGRSQELQLFADEREDKRSSS